MMSYMIFYGEHISFSMLFMNLLKYRHNVVIYKHAKWNQIKFYNGVASAFSNDVNVRTLMKK